MSASGRGKLAGVLVLTAIIIIAGVDGDEARTWGAAVSQDVVINELQYHAPSLGYGFSREAGEWLELFNASADAAAIGGWRFSGAIRYTFPRGAELRAGGYLVLARRPGVFRRLHPTFSGLLLGPYEGKLDNAGERLELCDDSGETVDALEWGDSPPWPTLPDGDGPTLERRHPGFESKLAGSWEASTESGGTPGRANTALIPDTHRFPPPWVVWADVRETPRAHGHSPQCPVTIEAKVACDDDPVRVEVLSQVVLPGEYVGRADPDFEERWKAKAMAPDALSGYRCELGPFPHRTLVRWRVRVEDRHGHVSFFPRERDPVPNRAVFFFEEATARMEEDRTHGSSHAGSAGDPWKSPIPVFFLLAHRRDVEDLVGRRALYGKDYRFSGTFVFEGRVYDHVRWRLRGGSSRDRLGKRSLKIKFHRDELLEGAEETGLFSHPHRRLNLNAPKAAFGLGEALSYEIFRTEGVETPESEFAHVRIVSTANRDDDFFGLYLAVEELDRHFLKSRDLSSGALFKMEGTPLERVASGKDRARLRELLLGLRSEPTPSWIREQVDVESYLGFRLAALLTETRDLGTRNYHLLFSGDEGRWALVPSDLNASFGLKTVSGHDLFSREVLGELRAEYETRLGAFARAEFLEKAHAYLEPLAASVEDIARADHERWRERRLQSQTRTARQASRYLLERLKRNTKTLSTKVLLTRERGK